MISPSTALATVLLAATTLVAAGCGGNRPPDTKFVDIVAMDYAYQAPSVATPGPTRFRLINRGQHRHEVQLYRFREGIGPDSAGKLLAMESYPDSLAEASGAVLVAQPGGTAPSEIYVVLDTGRVWALECAFRDSANAPRHNRLGMIGVLAVRR